MKVNIKIQKNMERELYILLMDLSTRASFSQMISMATVLIVGPTGEFMLDNGIKTKCMEKD